MFWSILFSSITWFSKITYGQFIPSVVDCSIFRPYLLTYFMVSLVDNMLERECSSLWSLWRPRRTFRFLSNWRGNNYSMISTELVHVGLTFRMSRRILSSNRSDANSHPHHANRRNWTKERTNLERNTGKENTVLSDKCLDCPHGLIEWITSDSSSVFIITENQELKKMHNKHSSII